MGGRGLEHRAERHDALPNRTRRGGKKDTTRYGGLAENPAEAARKSRETGEG